MSDKVKERSRAQRRLRRRELCRALYKPWPKEGCTWCVYCGLPADTKDHVPPLEVLDGANAEEIKSLTLRLVPACRECNSVLSSRPLFTIKDRREFVRRKMKKRYKAVLATPDWDESELAELEGMLRDSVESGLRLRDLTRARLRFTYQGASSLPDDESESG